MLGHNKGRLVGIVRGLESPLLSLLVVLNLFDFISTFLGVSIGLVESNPVFYFLGCDWGVFFVYIVFAWVVLFYVLFKLPLWLRFPVIFEIVVFQFYNVVSNFYLIQLTLNICF